MLRIFEAEGEPAVEGEEEDGAADDAGDCLRPGERRQLVEAVYAVADGGAEDYRGDQGLALKPDHPEEHQYQSQHELEHAEGDRGRPRRGGVDDGGVCEPGGRDQAERRGPERLPADERENRRERLQRKHEQAEQERQDAALSRRDQAELVPLNSSEPTPKAKNASGNGLASGRSTILVASSIRAWRSSWFKLYPFFRAAARLFIHARPGNETRRSPWRPSSVPLPEDRKNPVHRLR